MKVQAFYKNFENPCYFTIEISPREASCLLIDNENVSGKLRQHLFSLLKQEYDEKYLMPLVEKIEKEQQNLRTRHEPDLSQVAVQETKYREPTKNDVTLKVELRNHNDEAWIEKTLRRIINPDEIAYEKGYRFECESDCWKQARIYSSSINN